MNMTDDTYQQEKSDNKMRVFDTDGYRQRAASICVRNENEDQVNLFLSSPSSFFVLIDLVRIDFINHLSS